MQREREQRQPGWLGEQGIRREPGLVGGVAQPFAAQQQYVVLALFVAGHISDERTQTRIGEGPLGHQQVEDTGHG